MAAAGDFVALLLLEGALSHWWTRAAAGATHAVAALRP